MKKTFKIIVVALIVVCLVMFIKVMINFPFSPDQLIVSHEPKKVEVIVVPSGEMERIEHALELTEQGYADTVFYSTGYMDNYRRDYISRNMRDDIQFDFVTNSISTYTDAQLTSKYLDKMDIHSIIVVTSPYHSYRVYRTFKRIMPDVSILSVPVENSAFNVEHAQSNDHSFSYQAFRSEQLKYLFYAFRYGI